ncbi:M phase phosphoprotein 10 [Linum perenne]
MGKPSEEVAGMEALNRLKTTEPQQWLAPSPPLSEAARAALKHLFSSLRPHVRKLPFDELLVDGFDAEQIWQQIDLLTQPLTHGIGRRVKQWEKNPEEIETLVPEVAGGGTIEEKKTEQLAEDGDMDVDVDDDNADEDGDMDVDDDDEEEESEEEEQKGLGIEDKFLKIKELQEHLEEEEAKHYGLDSKKKKSKKSEGKKLEDEDDDSEDDEDDEEEEDELDLFGGGDVEEDDMGNASYEDFFGAKKGRPEKKSKFGVEDTSSEEEEGPSSDDEEDKEKPDEKPQVLSTHEKELQKKRAEIEKLEKANLDPKIWTMRGEVTAADRPNNSALEFDLDFEHNVRPVPVITEEVTQSLEEMIKKRILEGQFNDVKRAPALPSKAPKELKQMDENKSSEGLGKIYEEEYVRQTNPSAAPLSFSDEQKTEASTLFKKICLKLDALSHFHFAPKPVIEDMTIQSNVPALAMEEIAPIAVSDAAMLAPEEVFSGKGNVKAEVELTQEERKRRRATKKRKNKAKMARKMESKKAREEELQSQKDVTVEEK